MDPTQFTQLMLALTQIINAISAHPLSSMEDNKPGFATSDNQPGLRLSREELVARLAKQPLTALGSTNIFTVVGLVQGNVAEGTILLSPLTDTSGPCGTGWVPIAVSMIQSGNIIGSIACGIQRYAVASLTIITTNA